MSAHTSVIPAKPPSTTFPLWRWLVVYPVTRAIFFIVVTVAGSLLAAAVAILGVILAGLVLGAFALVVLAVLIVMAVMAPAPVLLSPAQWGNLTAKLTATPKKQ